MDLLQIIKDLISFRTITGNTSEIDKCLAYIQDTLLSSGADVKIHRDPSASPVIFAKNTSSDHFDVLILGHIDVVPAEDKMFNPVIKEGKLYARGALDMKSFAAVAIHSMNHIMQTKSPLKFGFILSTDEETGSKSLEAFLKKNPDLKADIVLDNDVGGDVTKIIARCKNPVYVRLYAKGQAAHGSTPWNGIDANEQLFETWQNIRKLYPKFSLKTGAPKDTWIDTVHFATIEGGKVSNIISGEATALLDFRLTEKSSLDNLKQNLKNCMADGVSFEIEMASIPVVADEKNPVLLCYKNLAEEILEHKVDFEYMGGATDSRALYERGATIIMHSGSGDGMHASNEYVILKSVEDIADIQTRFLDMLGKQK